MKRLFAGLVALAIGCQPDAGPGRVSGPISASPSVAHAEELASTGWQATAANLVAQNLFSPIASGRIYSLVCVAQNWAVQNADESGGDDEEDGGEGRGRLDAERGAVAGASAVVLSFFVPAQTQALEDMVSAQRNAARSPDAFARGEAAGRAAGAAIVTRAQTDGFTNPFTGTIPTGPGLWISNTTPPTIAAGSLPGTRPWFLTSASQFRSGPPPAFGSTDFLTALAEIRQISDTRTAQQEQIAAYWALNPGTIGPVGFWLHVATDGITTHGYSERRATHLYALLSATMFDAQIACWDAKETYWFIRPWQADPLISVLAAVGKPNHPSYPSGHSCVSSSAGAVLSKFFPEQRDALNAMVIEAGLARMYGGIHYRFDIEAGQQIGRSVAAFTLQADKSHHSVLSVDDDE